MGKYHVVKQKQSAFYTKRFAADVLLAKFRKILLNNGVLGTKTMAATKKRKRAYLAGQASRFEVGLQ